MRRCQGDGQVEWLEFDLLSAFPRIQHAVFLRHGGYSQGAFFGLNAGFHVGDDPKHVEANIELMQAQLQLEAGREIYLIRGRGNHGKSLVRVDARSLREEVPDVDGLMTEVPGISLMMTHADCQVALFYDPQRHAAAAVHAGWRGSVANIYGEAVEAMRRNFGSHPSDLRVCISPSLGPHEAEFVHYRSELPEPFWSFQVRSEHFDFWSISEWQLQAAGVLPHHIEVARLSTYANSRDFYSYRREKITGRHATCVTLL